jgi:hypothetical protein
VKNFDIGTLRDMDTSTKTLVLEADIYRKPYIGNVNIGKNKLDKFIEKIKIIYGASVYDSSYYDKIIRVKGEKIWIYINTQFLHVTICYGSDREYLEFLERFKEYLVGDDRSSISVWYYYLNSHGVQYNCINVEKSRVQGVLPDLYPDIDIVSLNREFKNSKESLLFLTGKPGVGKTSFIRYMLNSYESNKLDNDFDEPTPRLPRIAYAKDMNIMIESEFWSSLASNDFDLIVFDDLDFALSERKPGDNGFVNNLLSYSDGVLGNTARVVITTNLDVKDIDNALLRPGRCFDFLELHSLDAFHAINIWTNILGMDPDTIDPVWNKAEFVTQAALMSHFYRVSSETRERSYMKRGIKVYSVEDKVRDILRTQKAGFI